jgi:FAD/FMN-containing dehydrogenase
MTNLAAFYEDPNDRDLRAAWVSAFATALHQGDTGAYVNFLGEEGPARVHQAYPGSTWERLVAIKARYDPTNLFRLNQNIPLATHGA